MPDWAFRGDSTGTAPDQPRSRLVLSYRGDRPMLTPDVLSSVQRFARANSLGLTVAVQVARDSERSRALATALNADLVDWPANLSHDAQETRLRALYRESVLVLSDRLHVLIIAAIEGAVPANLVGEPDIKVARHFDAIGLHDLTLVSSARHDVPQFLQRMMARAGEVAQRTKGAFETINRSALLVGRSRKR